MRYTSDLTMEEFEEIKDLIPVSKTKPNIIERISIFNAILYFIKNACSWRDLSKDFPKWETVASQYYRWINDGTFVRISNHLYLKNRAIKGKTPYPHLLIIDSQAVDNTNIVPKEMGGFCHYKNVNGIKRHLMVDVLGNVIKAVCASANISDNAGLLLLIKENVEYFLASPHKMTMLLDNGYKKDYLISEIIKINPKLQEKIEIQISPKPQKKPKTPKTKSKDKSKKYEEIKEENIIDEVKGFVVEPWRWIVERTNAWLFFSHSLWKNNCKSHTVSTINILISNIQRTCKRVFKLSQLAQILPQISPE